MYHNFRSIQALEEKMYCKEETTHKFQMLPDGKYFLNLGPSYYSPLLSSLHSTGVSTTIPKAVRPLNVITHQKETPPATKYQVEKLSFKKRVNEQNDAFRNRLDELYRSDKPEKTYSAGPGSHVPEALTDKARSKKAMSFSKAPRKTLTSNVLTDQRLPARKFYSLEETSMASSTFPKSSYNVRVHRNGKPRKPTNFRVKHTTDAQRQISISFLRDKSLATSGFLSKPN